MQFTVTKVSSSATTGMAVVLEESTTRPADGFPAVPDTGWYEEVSMSMGKVTIDHRAWASL